MRYALVFALAAVAAAADSGPAASLTDVARVATVMVDGDICKRIQTPRSERFMLKKDPRDPWVDGDNFDVDQAAFTQTKKTLMRLARLCPQECDLNLWMPVKTDPPQIQILIRNVHEMSQFWPWGALRQEMPAEMKRVLEAGETVTVARTAGMTSVLTPVYDSLGDVVGLVEVVSQSRPDPRENVK
jgi:hypothetical protein